MFLKFKKNSSSKNKEVFNSLIRSFKEVLQLALACVYPGTTKINCSSNRKKKNKKLAIATISNTKLVKLPEEVWQWDETRRST